MNERDLEKLSKAELIKMVEKLQKKARKPKIVIADDDHRPVPAPRTNKAVERPIPKSHKSVKRMVNECEDLILPSPQQFRDGYKPIPAPRPVQRPVPAPRPVKRPVPLRDPKTGSFIKKNIKDAQAPVQLQKTN